MLEALRGCLGRAPPSGTVNGKREMPEDCIFCGITKERGFNVAFEVILRLHLSYEAPL